MSQIANVHMQDAAGAAMPGLTLTVTVDGVAGAGTVTPLGGGDYRYNLTTAEGATRRVIVVTAPLARTVRMFWTPAPLDAAGTRTAIGLAAANLDTQIGSRATQASVDAIPTTPLLTNDSRLNNLNAPIGAIPTTPLLANDPRLAHLDAAVSSRLGTADYVAPDNAAIVAAKVAAEAVNARISTAGITVVPTLLPGMHLLLMRDFDYPSIDFADTSWPSLTGNVVTISIDGHVYATTVKSATAFQLTLTRAQTQALIIGLHPMHAEVLIGTQRRLLFTGICEVANVS